LLSLTWLMSAWFFSSQLALQEQLRNSSSENTNVQVRTAEMQSRLTALERMISERTSELVVRFLLRTDSVSSPVELKRAEERLSGLSERSGELSGAQQLIRQLQVMPRSTVCPESRFSKFRLRLQEEKSLLIQQHEDALHLKDDHLRAMQGELDQLRGRSSMTDQEARVCRTLLFTGPCLPCSPRLVAQAQEERLREFKRVVTVR
jgi:hypothetical protein